jgi:predicted RNA-binding protein with PUA-like domain
MQYWLMKTEPDTYSWDDLVRDTTNKGGEEWSGVRNYEARNNMRNMKVGEQIFVYHSVNEKKIVGIATVVAEAHPDSTDSTGKWDCVDVAAMQPLSRHFSLDEAKTRQELAHMVLVRRGRLSVQPVSPEEWNLIINECTI